MDRVTVALLPLFLIATAASAETGKLVVNGSLVERLTDRVKTSGNLLVGMRFGPVSGRFQPNNIKISVADGVRGQSVCVHLSSRDGRYRALARYSIPPDSARSPELDFPTKYEDELGKLDLKDIAARAIISATCDETSDGPLIPALLSIDDRPEAADLPLIVQVNPGEARVSARLVDRHDSKSGSSVVPCQRKTDGPNIAFSHQCEIPVPQHIGARRMALELTIIELTDGRSVRRFDVEIPGK